MQKVFCPVDYGFITEICPNGRFCVIGDSDDCLIMELQARDVESHLLRIAPKRKSLRQRLSRLRREIAAVAGAWTTTEHRRSAKHTIYYHENDLPSDLAQRVAPFEALVDAVLARMSPPVSHVAHFHWVAAVRAYRDNMIRGGSAARVELLDDPRNLSAAR